MTVEDTDRDLVDRFIARFASGGTVEIRRTMREQAGGSHEMLAEMFAEVRERFVLWLSGDPKVVEPHPDIIDALAWVISDKKADAYEEGERAERRTVLACIRYEAEQHPGSPVVGLLLSLADGIERGDHKPKTTAIEKPEKPGPSFETVFPETVVHAHLDGSMRKYIPVDGVELKKMLEAAKQEALAGPWEDADDEWTPAVKAAFPTRSGSHDQYATAMKMVGHRHGKGALVALVNWLLLENKKGEAALQILREWRTLWKREPADNRRDSSAWVMREIGRLEDAADALLGLKPAEKPPCPKCGGTKLVCDHPATRPIGWGIDGCGELNCKYNPRSCPGCT